MSLHEHRPKLVAVAREVEQRDDLGYQPRSLCRFQVLQHVEAESVLGTGLQYLVAYRVLDVLVDYLEGLVGVLGLSSPVFLGFGSEEGLSELGRRL